MAEPGFLIREMRAEDIPEIVDIERASFSSPWSETAFQGELHKEYAVSRVAELRHDIVGYAIANYILNEGHILNMAVHPGYRRQGIATSLLHELLKILQQKGCSLLYLEVRISNAPAHFFYEKLEFRIVGKRKNYYTSPVEDALLMFRTI
jgi:ribosomal-protein-alanine N-acetyltransferase